MFKKIIVLIICVVLLPCSTVFAQTSEGQEKVDNFSVQLEIQKDAKVYVTEKIEYDFGNQQKHGIFRNIPFQYHNLDGSLYTVGYVVQSITDEHLVPYNYTTSYEGINFLIKIGDANTLVTGKKIYQIKYLIEPAISFFADHDELYWNVTGNSWTVPIVKASAQVRLPQFVPTANAPTTTKQYVCYMGVAGSKDTACTKNHSSNSVFNFFTTRPLESGEGLTLVVGFPKGVVKESPPTVVPTSTAAYNPDDSSSIYGKQDYSVYSYENAPKPWGLIYPFLTIIAYFVLKYRFNPEPKGLSTIIPEYDAPDSLSPLEVGALFDERIDYRDISSLFIDLAVRGYIRIKEIDINKKSDYRITKLSNPKPLTKPWEQFFIEKVFGKKKEALLSDLNTQFYDEAKVIEQKVLGSLIKQGYVNNQKPILRKYFIWGGVVWLPIGILLSIVTDNPWNMFGGFLAAITSLVCACGGAPFYTKKGAETRDTIQGFRWFLMVTEEERLKFHNAPAKKPELFEKFLPYAMVLDVEKEWATQFEGIYKQPPSWYDGSFNNSFNAVLFTNSLTSFARATTPPISSFASSSSSNFSTTPSSFSGFSGGGSSGGSSGGGFGGGGGGSW